MPTLTDVFRQYGPAYLQKYGAAMPAAHRKAMGAIAQCRTGELGYAVYYCDACGTQHQVPRSCGNRHCPTCQQHKTREWLDKQMARLMPSPYFLITFTLRARLRRVARTHQRIVYAAMFQAAATALQALAADPRFVGTRRLGFVAVLHTWGRQLDYHPHIHLIVPAGGLAEDGRRWCPSRDSFFVPVRALSKLYRAELRKLLQRAGLAHAVDRAVWKALWVVHCKAVGDGRYALRYLAPYVFRVAISNRRIVSCDNGRVVFQYRKSGSRRSRTMSLDAFEFIRRFLQHVLPSGFQKVRHYGFLSPASKQSIDEVRRMVENFNFCRELTATALAVAAPSAPEVRCPRCANPMRFVRMVLPPRWSRVPICDSG